MCVVSQSPAAGQFTCQSDGTWEDLFLPSSFALRPCPLSSLKPLLPKWGASETLSNVFVLGLGNGYTGVFTSCDNYWVHSSVFKIYFN